MRERGWIEREREGKRGEAFVFRVKEKRRRVGLKSILVIRSMLGS